MISVVIPSYNGAETLFQAIDSVLCQTTKTPLEILVIDDHSTDDTMEKMGRYGENDRVRYIRNETNKGASASRNRGVQLAKGDYIAFLDADDYWDPEKLEKQEKALAKTGDVLCCTGRELIYDQEPEKQKIFSVPERITYKNAAARQRDRLLVGTGQKKRSAGIPDGKGRVPRGLSGLAADPEKIRESLRCG